MPDPSRIPGRGPLYMSLMGTRGKDATSSLLLGNEKNMFV
jgi:hypothetical protein